jgi:predicted TIM-barrel fold metal-dependent hydrolase
LFAKLKKAFEMRRPMWKEDPREVFRRHVWVSPFFEDDLAKLASVIGVEHLLFGSDWPHAEGLADPLSYLDDLDEAGFSEDDAARVVYENAAGLALPPKATSTTRE